MLFRQALICIFLLLLSGCSNFNCTRLESLVGGDVDLVKLGNDISNTLIEEAFPPLLPRQPNQPVLLTSMVDNNDLFATSDFGRALPNHIASGFVRQGYTVKEIKLRGNMLIKEKDGEFLLSRDLEELNDKQQAQAVVVGTYSIANRIMYLNVRLVNFKDRTIRASYDKRLCLDENTLHSLGLQFQEESTIRPPRESWIDRVFY